MHLKIKNIHSNMHFKTKNINFDMQFKLNRSYLGIWALAIVPLNWKLKTEFKGTQNYYALLNKKYSFWYAVLKEKRIQIEMQSIKDWLFIWNN